jgi:hypothetical protein
VDRPQVEPTLDIRFLNEEEFKALLEAVDVAHEPLGHVDRAMFLAAAMTGLRQGGAARAPLARRRLASGEDSRSP